MFLKEEIFLSSGGFGEKMFNSRENSPRAEIS